MTSVPPQTQVLATVGNVRLQSPVAQGGVTAIGFHGSDEGALVLQPVGPQANEGLLARLWRRITGSSPTGLAWYQLEGGELRTLDVGAVAGTDVYSPVDGTVVAIRDQVIAGRTVGSEIELRPSSAPSLVVAIENVSRTRRSRSARTSRRARRSSAASSTSAPREAGARALRAGRRQQRLHRGLPLGVTRRAVDLRAPLRILFIADVVGAPGRGALEARLAGLVPSARSTSAS